MTRILIAAVAVLSLTVAALSIYVIRDGGDAAEADSPISCSVESNATEPPTLTATCTGSITVPTPGGPMTITFTLVVDANDNPPLGPSFGDQITGCTLDTGSGPVPISVGPCP